MDVYLKLVYYLNTHFCEWLNQTQYNEVTLRTGHEDVCFHYHANWTHWSTESFQPTHTMTQILLVAMISVRYMHLPLGAVLKAYMMGMEVLSRHCCLKAMSSASPAVN